MSARPLLETDDTLLIAFVCLSKAWLDKLPPDLAKTIVDEAPQAAALGRTDRDR